MIVIRLARRGSRNHPFYQVVISDNRCPRDGRFIDRVGFFDPLTSKKNESICLDLSRINYWINRGAHLSNRVSALIKKVSR